MNEKKRTLGIALVIVVLLVVTAFGYNYLVKGYDGRLSKDDISTKDNSIAKDFTVYDSNGNEVKLSDYKGKKAVVVNMWATWCSYCKTEMPYFQNAQNKYNNEDVEMLMVNLTDGKRETKEKALDFMKSNNYTMNVVFDEDFNAAEVYEVSGIPRTLFIDKDGNLVKDHTGVMNEELLYSNIEKLIE